MFESHKEEELWHKGTYVEILNSKPFWAFRVLEYKLDGQINTGNQMKIGKKLLVAGCASCESSPVLHGSISHQLAIKPQNMTSVTIIITVSKKAWWKFSLI